MTLAQSHPVLPVTAKVEGRGQAELTQAWWQWALSRPLEPTLDPDGRHCDSGQEGPVWFLAGTDGSFHVSRRCRVPVDRHLLLPVLPRIQHTKLGAKRGHVVEKCKELQAAAAVERRLLRSAVVIIDGAQVEDIGAYRVRSKGCFPLYPEAEEDDRFLAPVGASDGYWLLIRPLPLGRHTIVVGAIYDPTGTPRGQTVQNFEYEIIVTPGGAVLEL